ncbi:Nif3-like dinuclear metal center hexameric protein [Gracilibacillus suaedae]|uniref:Nif3-like dinuclear metal center hexameric protein n=1 Tax=Gracilibacillus suaedae TaxID=2820273 RepID=UPI001ABE6AE1|nr:Nif3-like dinuclear metal center hexameric protein [Gracilibacillus suaedae]
MLTIKELMNRLMENIEPVENSVDMLIAGDDTKIVNKVAVAFMPTYEVIKQAIASGANLLICHEGAFYSHDDNKVATVTDVYQQKVKLIQESGIVIWRLHDYIHRYQPDGIMQGMIKALNWDSYVKQHHTEYTLFDLPIQSLQQVTEHIKSQLQLDRLQYVGDLSQNITKVAILVGFRGGGINTIPALENDADVVVYGEGPEWETPEFTRDALAMGKNKAAIILGHLESEEPGMLFLSEYLSTIYPIIPVEFIPTNNCIKTI